MLYHLSSFFLDKPWDENPGDSVSYIYEAVLADGELNSPCISEHKASTFQKTTFVLLHLVRHETQ